MSRPLFFGNMSTIASKTMAEAQARARALYRHSFRYLPTLRNQYELDFDLPYMQDRLRSQFLKRGTIHDKDVLDMLVFRGRQEFYETFRKYKTKTHILDYFVDSAKVERALPSGPSLQNASPFLKEFLRESS